jgi:hypothetical protein
MPLSFLSGTFYSVKSLPWFLQYVNYGNPFFYIIDGFRYCFTSGFFQNSGRILGNFSNLQKNKDEEATNVNNSILKNDYFKIFYSGYEVWKINPIIGTGVKSFNLSCSEAYKTNNNLLCAPHAHNIYLELLVNTGIVGTLIFVTYIFYYLKWIKNILINKNNSIYLYLLIIFICELFPLRSYGSIFQTVNGSMFWVIVSLMSSIKWIKLDKITFSRKIVKFHSF